MRTQVISFLKTLGSNPEENYNEGLTLFMKSPNANRSLVRAYNTQGYSAQRLNELVYDLKQAHNIEASDIAEVVENVSAKVITLTPDADPNLLVVQLPEFAKGVEGNAQRKAYLAEHGIVSESFKNADMDAAISKFLLDKAEATIASEKNIEVKAEEVVIPDADIPKIETDVQENATDVSIKETIIPDTEKK